MLIEVPNASFKREKDLNGIEHNPFTSLKAYRLSTDQVKHSVIFSVNMYFMMVYDEYIKDNF